MDGMGSIVGKKILSRQVALSLSSRRFRLVNKCHVIFSVRIFGPGTYLAIYRSFIRLEQHARGRKQRGVAPQCGGVWNLVCSEQILINYLMGRDGRVKNWAPLLWPKVHRVSPITSIVNWTWYSLLGNHGDITIYSNVAEPVRISLDTLSAFLGQKITKGSGYGWQQPMNWTILVLVTLS
jgi:hypothetical protein